MEKTQQSLITEPIKFTKRHAPFDAGRALNNIVSQYK